MRRSDAYEFRARALAALAGLDPNSRIAAPGERGMPAWCTFRDAARAEHLAAEAAALVMPEQPAQHRDAPMAMFGEHDATTLAQMRHCMGVGRDLITPDDDALRFWRKKLA